MTSRSDTAPPARGVEAFTESEKQTLLDMIMRELAISADRLGVPDALHSTASKSISAFYPATLREKLDIDRQLSVLANKLRSKP